MTAATPWWAWLLPLGFASPWIAAIAWVRMRRVARGDETQPPSMAELARRRLLD